MAASAAGGVGGGEFGLLRSEEMELSDGLLRLERRLLSRQARSIRR